MATKTNARYFLRDRAQGDVFWEIAVVGSDVRIRSGAADELGKTSTKTFASAEAAASDAAKQIAKKVAEKYVEQTGDVVWVTGKGKRPLLARVALDSDRVVLGFYNGPQEEIDLAPLVHAHNMTELDISRHKLKQLDLSPLASCAKLRELYLSNIGLKAINLAPLVNSRSLEELTVRDLKSVDLSQLAGCPALHTLSLMGGEHKTIDLAPLMKLPKIATLHLQQNSKLKSIDVRPIAAHKTLKLITLDEACTVEGESSIEFRRF